MLRTIHRDDIARHAASAEIERALALYEAARPADGGLPRAGDVEEALGRRAAWLVHLALHGADDLRYLRVGEAAASQLGADLTGHLISALPGEAGAFIRGAYLEAVRELRPLLAVQAAPDPSEAPLWERLVLPCRDGAEAQLLVLVRPREDEAAALRAVLEASTDGILALRAVRDGSGAAVDAVVINANRRAGECLGRPLKTLINSSVRDLIPGGGEAGSRGAAAEARRSEGTSVLARCLRVIASRGVERFDVQRDMAGLDTWFQVTASPLGDGVLLQFSDVTALKYALFEMEVLKEQAELAREELASEIAARQMVEGELRRIAVTDGLTGVLNRRGFDEVARTMTATARRYKHPLSVIAIDIDHFKRVNDVHGHAAGDAVLMRVAMTVSCELRGDTDAVSRMGGEEFMVLLPHTDAGGAAVVAERLRRRVMDTPIPFGDTVIRVTASFGVRELPESGDAERMLIEADAALYQAKQSGRNCVVTAGEAGPDHQRAA